MGIWRLATTLVWLNHVHVPQLLVKWKNAQATYGKREPTVDCDPLDDSTWLHTWNLQKETSRWMLLWTA